MQKFSGIVFDFDGILADTIEAHNVARIEAFRTLGFTTDAALHAEGHHHGSHPHEIIGWVLQQSGAVSPTADVSTDPTVQRVVDKKNEIYRQSATQGMEAVVGAVDLVKWCAQTYSPTNLAIATTASYDHEVLPFLQKYDLQSSFRVVVGSEVTPQGRLKPDPFIYELAAKELGIKPGLLVAVEDSPRGIEAAKGAHFFTMGVATTHRPEDLASADAVIAGLSDVRSVLE